MTPRLGLYIDLWSVRANKERSSWADIERMARLAEESNFDSIWVPDRFQMGEIGVWESTTMLSAIAAVTSKVALGTAVIRSIYRNPTLLAKIVASIEEISGGRLILGLGAGSDEGDNRQFGYPEDHPFSRFEEALTVVLSLLRTGSAEHSGTYYKANDAVLNPKGPRRDGPPLLLAATGPKMMRLAAKHADYWNMPIVPVSPVEWLPHLDALERACELEGRDPQSIKKIAGVGYTGKFVGDHPYGSALTGGPREVADGLRAFFEAGFHEVIVWPAPNSSDAVAEMANVVAELKEAG